MLVRNGSARAGRPGDPSTAAPWEGRRPAASWGGGGGRVSAAPSHAVTQEQSGRFVSGEEFESR